MNTSNILIHDANGYINSNVPWNQERQKDSDPRMNIIIQAVCAYIKPSSVQSIWKLRPFRSACFSSMWKLLVACRLREHPSCIGPSRNFGGGVGCTVRAHQKFLILVSPLWTEIEDWHALQLQESDAWRGRCPTNEMRHLICTRCIRDRKDIFMSENELVGREEWISLGSTPCLCIWKGTAVPSHSSISDRHKE